MFAFHVPLICANYCGVSVTANVMSLWMSMASSFTRMFKHLSYFCCNFFTFHPSCPSFILLLCKLCVWKDTKRSRFFANKFLC